MKRHVFVAAAAGRMWPFLVLFRSTMPFLRQKLQTHIFISRWLMEAKVAPLLLDGDALQELTSLLDKQQLMNWESFAAGLNKPPQHAALNIRKAHATGGLHSMTLRGMTAEPSLECEPQ